MTDRQKDDDEDQSSRSDRPADALPEGHAAATSTAPTSARRQHDRDCPMCLDDTCDCACATCAAARAFRAKYPSHTSRGLLLRQIAEILGLPDDPPAAPSVSLDSPGTPALMMGLAETTRPGNYLGFDRSWYPRKAPMTEIGDGGFVRHVRDGLMDGVCPACGATIPLARGRAYTCDEVCHAQWIEALIRQYGETRPITHLETGKVYAVPTRVILESGIKGSDLAKYPEVTPEATP